eukprot:COSAG01_NODE_3391_length_6151_cov_4.717944_1_plen_99_part_00
MGQLEQLATELLTRLRALALPVYSYSVLLSKRNGPLLLLFYLSPYLLPHTQSRARAPVPFPATVPCRLAAPARCRGQLGDRGSVSRRAWRPCRGCPRP